MKKMATGLVLLCLIIYVHTQDVTHNVSHREAVALFRSDPDSTVSVINDAIQINKR
jgi:hypothetical protein